VVKLPEMLSWLVANLVQSFDVLTHLSELIDRLLTNGLANPAVREVSPHIRTYNYA
jgi:hypothetical protein